MKYQHAIAGMFAAFAMVTSATAATVYENGSPLGTYDALSISPPQLVSNSFTLLSPRI